MRTITSVTRRANLRAIDPLYRCGQNRTMDAAMKSLKRVIGIALLASVAPLGLLADRPSREASGRTKTSCYCRCSTREMKQECTKMCELPKYENRSWATSCHKRAAKHQHQSPESRPHPSKHSGVETARR